MGASNTRALLLQLAAVGMVAVDRLARRIRAQSATNDILGGMNLDLSQTFKADGRIPEHVQIKIRMAMIAGMDKPASSERRMPKVKGGCKGWEVTWGKRDERMMEVLFYINDNPGTSIGKAASVFGYVYSTVGDYVKSLRDKRLITTVRHNGLNKSYNTITALGRQRLAQINDGER